MVVCEHNHPCSNKCCEPCGECAVPVSVTLACGHICTDVPCNVAARPEAVRCEATVQHTFAACGHSAEVLCAELSEGSLLCKRQCEEVLQCGHVCPQQCGSCRVVLNTTAAAATSTAAAGATAAATAGTTAGTTAGVGGAAASTATAGTATATASAATADSNSCSTPGTSAVNRMEVVETVVNHAHCKQRCERTLICGHTCNGTAAISDSCHGSAPCPPCTQKSATRCVHLNSSRYCAEVSAACTEHCAWECEHKGRCPILCAAPCIRLPCDERCSKKLLCKHRCPGLCGEECVDTRWCAVCGDKQHAIVDLIRGAQYKDVDIDVPRHAIIELPCNHAFTVESLDELFEIDRGYTHTYTTTADATIGAADDTTTDTSNSITAVSGSDSSSKRIRTTVSSSVATGTTTAVKHWTGVKALEGQWSIKQCPACKAPIHGIMRYGRVHHTAELQALELKFALACQKKLQQLRAPTPAHAAESSGSLSWKQQQKLKQYQQHVEYAHGGAPTFDLCQQQPLLLYASLQLKPEVLVPSAQPLIDAQLALGSWCAEALATNVTTGVTADNSAISAEMARAARSALHTAIKLSDNSDSAHDGAIARLLLARVLVLNSHLMSTNNSSSTEEGEMHDSELANWQQHARQHLQWVVSNEQANEELRIAAVQLMHVIATGTSTEILCEAVQGDVDIETHARYSWCDDNNITTTSNGKLILLKCHDISVMYD
jgi:hypothetical protein